MLLLLILVFLFQTFWLSCSLWKLQCIWSLWNEFSYTKFQCSIRWSVVWVICIESNWLCIFKFCFYWSGLIYNLICRLYYFTCLIISSTPPSTMLSISTIIRITILCFPLCKKTDLYQINFKVSESSGIMCGYNVVAVEYWLVGFFNLEYTWAKAVRELQHILLCPSDDDLCHAVDHNIIGNNTF